MSNLNNRLSRLEDEQAPKDTKIFVICYNPVTKRAVAPSSPELIGLLPEEIKIKLARLEEQKTVLLNVVRRNDIVTAYLPDNGRDE